jgi:hypothetical protein
VAGFFPATAQNMLAASSGQICGFSQVGAELFFSSNSWSIYWNASAYEAIAAAISEKDFFLGLMSSASIG